MIKFQKHLRGIRLALEFSFYSTAAVTENRQTDVGILRFDFFDELVIDHFDNWSLGLSLLPNLEAGGEPILGTDFGVAVVNVINLQIEVGNQVKALIQSIDDRPLAPRAWNDETDVIAVFGSFVEKRYGKRIVSAEWRV